LLLAYLGICKQCCIDVVIQPAAAAAACSPSALICRVEMSDSTIMMASAPRPAQHTAQQHSNSTAQHKDGCHCLDTKLHHVEDSIPHHQANSRAVEVTDDPVMTPCCKTLAS
jgi:hypothetical protein